MDFWDTFKANAARDILCALVARDAYSNYTDSVKIEVAIKMSEELTEELKQSKTK